MRSQRHLPNNTFHVAIPETNSTSWTRVFSMRQETPTPNSRLHLQTRTCARSLATVWFTLSMVQTRAPKGCTFRDAEHLACTICPLMTHMPVLSMNNVQTSEHVSLKLHPVFCRWPRKKRFRKPSSPRRKRQTTRTCYKW